MIATDKDLVVDAMLPIIQMPQSGNIFFFSLTIHYIIVVNTIN